MVSSLTFDIWQGRHRRIKKSRRQEGSNLYSKRKKCTYVNMCFFCLFVSVADESNVGSLAGTTAGETT